MNGRLFRYLTASFVLAVISAQNSALQAAAFRDQDHSQSVLSLGTASNQPTRLYQGGLPFFSVGLEFQDQTRTLILKDSMGGALNMDVKRLTGIIGVDIFPWLTLEAGAGMTDVDLEGENEAREKDWEWRVGGQVRLLDYRLPADEPYYFGLAVDSFFRASQSENWSSDMEWNEWYSALLFSLSNHPLIHFGDDVRAVTLYGGPALSLIDGTWSDDWGSVDFHEDQNMGAVLGLSFRPDEFMTIKIEGQYFDDASLGIGLAVHF